MEKKRWSDIPSLEGLQVDWGYSPNTRDGKRLHKRLTGKDIGHLLGASPVEVKMASAAVALDGTLRDLSEGGLGVDLNTRLEEPQRLKVGLVLGREKIICQRPGMPRPT